MGVNDHEAETRAEVSRILAETRDDYWDNQPPLTGILDRTEVEHEVHRMRVMAEARRLYRAEQETGEPYDLATLAEVAARPESPPDRVQGLMHHDGDTLIVAKRKTGKTTLTLNLARSLLTGEPFLGALPVEKVRGSVAMLNYEVSAAMLGKWGTAIGVPGERLLTVNLRGRRNPLLHRTDRQALAAVLKEAGTETIVVDTFAKAFTGTSHIDAGEVARFLSDLDEFAHGEVEATDLVLTTHSGWVDDDRSRGSSALEDWPDSIVVLTADDEGDRYLRGFGRDVDLEEVRLFHDPETHRLTVIEGSGGRADSNLRRAGLVVWTWLVENGETSRRNLKVPGVGNDSMKPTLEWLEDHHHIVSEQRHGKGGTATIYMADPTHPPA